MKLEIQPKHFLYSITAPFDKTYWFIYLFLFWYFKWFKYYMWNIIHHVTSLLFINLI